MSTENGSAYPSFLGVGDFVYRSSDVPVFVSGNGVTLEDKNGFRYLDAEAANGTAGLGYDSTLLKEAVGNVSNFPMVPSFCETDIRLKVGARLESMVSEVTGVPGRVAFDLGGAQAVELALKIARHQRPGGIAVFEGAYHGRSLFTSKLSASARYRKTTPDWNPSVLKLPFPDCRRCRFGRSPDSCSMECLTYVRTSLSEEFAGPANAQCEPIATFLFEPVLNVAGMVFPDPRYVNGLVKDFRERGAVIIVDEVFTGFYRTGKKFGFQHYDFTPDIIILSKALSNGISPISCVWAREPLLSAENFPPGTHSVTFANNMFGLSVVASVLDRYESMIDIVERTSKIEAALRDCFRLIKEQSRLFEFGEARGACARIVLRKPVAEDIRKMAMQISMERPIFGFHGIMLAATGMARDIINIHPPLVIEETELLALSLLLQETFKAIEEKEDDHGNT